MVRRKPTPPAIAPQAPPIGPLQELNLRDIARDEAMQVRRELDPGTVKKYAQAYRNNRDATPPLPPPIVGQVEAGYLLVSGFHRVSAMEAAGITKAAFRVVVGKNRQELAWLAAQENLTHGLPLTRDEIRAAFRRLIAADGHRQGTCGYYSLRELAALLGDQRSHTTIRDWLLADFPKVAKEMGLTKEDRPARTELPAGPSSAEQAVTAAEQAVALALTLKNPAERTVVAETLRGLLAKLEAAGLGPSLPF